MLAKQTLVIERILEWLALRQQLVEMLNKVQVEQIIKDLHPFEYEIY
jgi:hypothetical protein